MLIYMHYSTNCFFYVEKQIRLIWHLSDYKKKIEFVDTTIKRHIFKIYYIITISHIYNDVMVDNIFVLFQTY